MDKTTDCKILCNYQNVCRTCLSDTDELISIFINGKSQHKTYAEMIMACASIQILKTDEISLKICSTCINQIEQSHLFYKKCQEADLILKFSHKFYRKSQNESNNTENNIKQSNTVDLVRDQTSEWINEEIKLDDFEEGIEDESNDLTTSDFDCASLSSDILSSANNQINELAFIDVNSEEGIGNESDNSLSASEVDCATLSSDTLTKNQIEQNFEDKIIYSSKKIIVQCKFCLKSYISELSLEKHIEETHSKQTHECNECGFRYSSSKCLNKHKNAHSNGKVYICNVCNLKYLTTQHLNFHKVMHISRPKYVCKECGLIVTREVGFKNHKSTHDRSCRSKCEICGAELNKTSLKRHMSVHRTSKSPTPLTSGILTSANDQTNKLTNKDINSEHFEKEIENDSNNVISISDFDSSVPTDIITSVNNQTNELTNKDINSEKFDEEIVNDSDNVTSASNFDSPIPTDILTSVNNQTNELTNKDINSQKFEEEIVNDSDNVTSASNFDSPIPTDILTSVNNQTNELTNKDINSQKFEEEIVNDSDNVTSASNFDSPVPTDILTSVNNQTNELTNKDVNSKNFEEGIENQSNENDHSSSTSKVDCTSRSSYISIKEGTKTEQVTSSVDKNEKNKIVQCKFCLRTYISESSLAKHIETHSKHTHECNECGLKFSGSLVLNEHKKTHLDGKVYVCNICNLNFSTFKYVNIHKIIHQSKPKFICDECGQILSTLSSLWAHKNSLKRHTFLRSLDKNEENMDKNEENTIVQCKYCLKSYISELSLEKHKEIHAKQIHECYECGLIFSSTSDFNRHKKTHRNGKVYVCNICNLNFTAIHYMKIHKVLHLKKPEFICDECGRVFSCNISLNRHKSVHNESLKSNCKICGLKLTKKHLTRHMFLHSISKIKTVRSSKTSFKPHKASKKSDISLHSTNKSYNSLSSDGTQVEQNFKNKVTSAELDKNEENKIVQCKFCLKSWISQSTFEQHMEIHSSQTHECNECRLKFSSYLSLHQHKKLHLDGKVYACNICNLNYPTNQHLSLHKIIHVNKPKYFCNECGLVLSSNSSLKLHRLVHDGSVKSKCEVCGLNVHRGNLKRHMYQHKTTKPYICDKCGQGFIQLPQFRKHRMKCVHDTCASNKTRTRKEIYQCTACSKAFATKQYLSYHCQSKHPELEENTEYNCIHCKRTFKSKSLLNRHMLSHSSTLQTSCKICKMNFETYDKLQEHRKSEHKQNKRCQCQVCGRFLATPTTLENHMLIHTNARPHKCSFCDKRFNQTSHKFSHERLHTGEKPYTCVQCNKSFRHQTTLIEHNRQHTGETPYKCFICDKGFYRTGNLKKHLNSHK